MWLRETFYMEGVVKPMNGENLFHDNRVALCFHT
jgi:hypothetical protein